MDNMLDLANMLEESRNTLINTVDSGLGKLQDGFLQTKFGNVVDNAFNSALRAMLPDFVEDQVIDVKDAILQDGVKAGVNEAITSSLDLGKSVLGIFTGKFENISQIQNVVKKGGLIDAISSVLDKAIDMSVSSGLIDKSVGKIITSGKKAILKNVSSSIENSLESQVSSIEKLDKYCEKWQDAYKNQDIVEMDKVYKNINKQLENIIPLESTINKAREIENLQNFIKNNGGDFNISNDELELAKVL